MALRAAPPPAAVETARPERFIDALETQDAKGPVRVSLRPRFARRRGSRRVRPKRRRLGRRFNSAVRGRAAHARSKSALCVAGRDGDVRRRGEALGGTRERVGLGAEVPRFRRAPERKRRPENGILFDRRGARAPRLSNKMPFSGRRFRSGARRKRGTSAPRPTRSRVPPRASPRRRTSPSRPATQSALLERACAARPRTALLKRRPSRRRLGRTRRLPRRRAKRGRSETRTGPLASCVSSASMKRSGRAVSTAAGGGAARSAIRRRASACTNQRRASNFGGLPSTALICWSTFLIAEMSASAASTLSAILGEARRTSARSSKRSTASAHGAAWTETSAGP
mmetsp:Transcript_31001/g.106614  ORF Transcript_31001/g.106614 Transcript_31001/m.106614 type:complete len:341 (+) Transcript_31001:865-1887(+)